MTSATDNFDARTASAAEVEARLREIVRETKARRDAAKTADIAAAVKGARTMSAAELAAAERKLRRC